MENVQKTLENAKKPYLRRIAILESKKKAYIEKIDAQIANITQNLEAIDNAIDALKHNNSIAETIQSTTEIDPFKI